MGFNYFGYGCLHPCRVENGAVIYKLPSGLEVSHKTALEVNIPEQTNLFISDTVTFLLYHEGKEYVGRADGSISIYNQSDDLLVGLNYWDRQLYPETKLCGYYADGKIIKEVHVDLRDKQSLYVVGDYRESIAKSPIRITANTDIALNDAKIYNAVLDYSIYNERGEPVEADVWTVQEDVRRGNCRIFL